MSWVATAVTVVGAAATAYASSQGGDGGGYEAPEPTAEEKELMQEQLASIRETKQTYAKLDPLLLESMGIKEESTPGHYETKTRYVTKRERRQGLVQSFHTVTVPEQYQEWVPGETTYRRMTEEESIAAMSPTEKGAYDILGLQQERQIKALKGELPVSPALEAEIEKKKAGLIENLSGRLGPNWQTSTAGIQTMSEFNKTAGLLREEARRGEIAQGAGQTLAGQEAQQGAALAKQTAYGNYANRMLPLTGAATDAMQPYQYYAGLQNQAAQYNAQASAAQQAGLMGGLGQLAGAGLSAYGTYAGLKAQQPYSGGAGLLGSY